MEIGDENLGLPCDIFPSRFLYEVIRNRSVLIGLGSALLVCAFAFTMARKFISGDGLAVIRIFIVSLGMAGTAITGAIIEGRVESVILMPSNKVQFMKEIAISGPGLEMKKWGVVAAKMNPVLHKSSLLATPYYFYDGESCYSCFRNEYLHPYLRRKNTNDTQAYIVDEFKPFVDQVLKSYEESLNKDLQHMLEEEISVESQHIKL